MRLTPNREAIDNSVLHVAGDNTDDHARPEWMRPTAEPARARGRLENLVGPMHAGIQWLDRQVGFLWDHPGFRSAPLASCWRLLSWRLLTLLKRPSIVRLDRYDVELLLPSEWKGLSKVAFMFREHVEPALAHLDVLIRPGFVAVDLGAHYGNYTLPLSRLVGDDGEVLALEPGTHAFHVLKINVLLNHARNVRPIRCAAGAESGQAPLFQSFDTSRNSFSRPDFSNADWEAVQVQRLDDIVRELGIERVDFVKADIEGAEELALRGAEETIRKHGPVILLELHPGAAQDLGLSPLGAIEVLKDHDYSFFTLRDRDLVPLTNSSANRIGAEAGHLVALPSNA